MHHVLLKASTRLSGAIALLFCLSFLIASQCFAADTATTSATDSASTNRLATATAATAADNAKISLNSCQVTLASSLKYTAKPLTPAPKVKYAGKVLSKDKDYKVSYKNNKGIGTATVSIVGMGRFKGTVKKTFEIKHTNAAIAIAACRLSYSRPIYEGKKVNKRNGYRGTTLYQRYSKGHTLFSCATVVHATIAKYLKLDTKFPYGGRNSRKHMKQSAEWKLVGTYKPGKNNIKLKPGDVYVSGSHTCLYVGKAAPKIAYRDYFNYSAKAKKSLGKKCPDLGAPTSDSAWVSSHQDYMGGSAAHICNAKYALAKKGGLIFRYIGKGGTDPNGATR